MAIFRRGQKCRRAAAFAAYIESLPIVIYVSRDSREFSSFGLNPESQFRDLRTIASSTPDQALFGNTRIGCVAAEKVAK